MVSDAGTPALSDPGQIIISKCHDEGIIKVIPIPGPSAITASMSASGFADNFFLWIYTKKIKELKIIYHVLKSIKTCLVFLCPQEI